MTLQQPLSQREIQIQREKREDDLKELSAKAHELHPGDTVGALLNHRWVSLAVLAFLLSIASNNRALMAMTALMLVIVTIAWLWSRNTLINLVYRRKLRHTHAFPGETTEVEITIENKKWLPVTWLQVQDTWPTGFPPTRAEAMSESEGDPSTGYLTNAYALRWYERIRRRYDLLAQKRGVYELGPVNMLSGDPFGLFERLRTSGGREDYLIVYPEVKTLDQLGFPLQDPFGDRRVQRRLFEDPNRVIGVRDYQPQDTFRQIHWKATARTGQMQTKLYEPTRGASIVLAVNIASFETHWRGFWPEMTEYTLMVGASIAKWAVEQNYAVGLICNGALARSDQSFRIQPSRRNDQLTKILEALAGVNYFVTAEFGRFVLQESPRLPIGATIVMITPFISEMIAISSLRLRDSGRRVAWVNLGKKKPNELHGIRLYHLPIVLDEPTMTEDSLSISSASNVALATPLPNPDNYETPRQRFLRQQHEAEKAQEAEYVSPAR
ncbi:MAG: DUF58 domain-containing protein [Chloroflexi bacterium]|nr:DUF58 domain-containing protein [Chloroflexota bacterium]